MKMKAPQKKIARQMVKEDEAEYVTHEYIRELEEDMLQAARDLNFEKAAEIRDRVLKLQSETRITRINTKVGVCKHAGRI